MKNHFESSRFTVVIIVTVLCLTAFVIATATNKDIAIAMAGPMFLALGVLWGAVGGSKIAEHATSHLREKNNG